VAEVTYSSWFDRIGKSVGGVLGSFAFLYWNEGSLDLSKYAKTAVDVKADITAEGADGKLVDISGKVDSDETLGDDLFLLPGKYLTYNRTAQVYAWVEEKETTTRKDAVGGGETTTTTYKYKKEWVSRATRSEDFNQREVQDWESRYSVRIDNSRAEKQNFESKSDRVSSVRMGKYTMSTSGLSLPGQSILSPLDDTTVKMKDIGGFKPGIEGSTIYLRKNGSSSDNVGDERLTYSVLKSGFDGTAFGKLAGSELQSYTVKGQGGDALKHKGVLFHIFAGDKDQAVATLHSEYSMMLWIFRIIGFLAMWIGAMLVLDPLSTVLDIVGVIGSVSRFLINAILFVITLVLSFVTIVIGAIAHNVIVLVIVLAVIIGVIFFLVMQKKNSAGGASGALK